jgi:branched-chain amino acid transport system substrate-binding protein
MAKKIIVVLLALVLLAMPVMASCKSGSTETENTLKVGVAVGLNWPLGLDLKKSLDVISDQINKAGGMDIGGKKYQVQFILYDTQNEQNQTMANVNKLIYQDKVGFILTDSPFIGSVVQETEKNKIVCMAGTATPAIFDPSFKYSFQAGVVFFATPEVTGWIAKNYPQIKTVGCAFPDNQAGHSYGGGVVATLEANGIKVNSYFYPETSTDLSSVATKIKNDNPDAFMAAAGGAGDLMAYKALRTVGYKGLLFSTTTIPTGALETAITGPDIEGFISAAWPVEFEPAATQMAKDFKAAYIAKNGKWDDPEIQFTMLWTVLRAALEKAGTTDTTKVADVIAGGLTWEGPTGKGRMVPRNDLGISRTVDSVSEFCIKKVVGDKATLAHTITVDEGIGYLPPGIVK